MKTLLDVLKKKNSATTDCNYGEIFESLGTEKNVCKKILDSIKKDIVKK